MARPLRIQFPGAVYHVISRGNKREPIVRDDDDREKRVDGLQCAVETYGWHLFAFVLMTKALLDSKLPIPVPSPLPRAARIAGERVG